MSNRELTAISERKPGLVKQVVKPKEAASDKQDNFLAHHDPTGQVVCRLGDGSCAKAHAAKLNNARTSQTAHTAQSILKLQRQYGNRYVQRVLAIKNGGKNPFANRMIQYKLKISRPNDKYEKEADHVADMVLQRQCVTPECDEEERVQTRQSSNTIESNEGISEQILQQKGNGRPLEPETRKFMESRFGYDFGNVRLHTDTYAAKNSNELYAEAFTIGRDIFFNVGRYNPSTNEGRRLLAHELTHVVQQKNINVSSSSKINSANGHMIQFQRYRDCTPAITGTTGVLTQDQIDNRILGARMSGESMAIFAVAAVRNIRAGGGTAAERAAFANHFGAPTAAQINIIFTRFTNIERRLSNDRLFVCNTAGSHYCRTWNAWAYTWPGGLSNLTHLCPTFFQDPCCGRAGGTDMVLIHEAAHAAGALDDTYPGAGYPPANAENNAPSYASFANDVF